MAYLSLVLILGIFSAHAMETKQQLPRLCHAVRKGNLDKVKYLLRQHPALQNVIDVPHKFQESSYYYKASPFYIACAEGHFAIAQFFLESGYVHNINHKRAGDEGTAIHGIISNIIFAENCNNHAEIDRLIPLLYLLRVQYKASINKRSGIYHTTPLHYAVLPGSVNLVEELIALGAKPYRACRSGIRLGSVQAKSTPLQEVQAAKQDCEKFGGSLDEYDKKITLMQEVKAKHRTKKSDNVSVTQ